MFAPNVHERNKTSCDSEFYSTTKYSIYFWNVFIEFSLPFLIVLSMFHLTEFYKTLVYKFDWSCKLC